MNIYKLIDKLEPLIPQEAQRWRRALPLVDEATRKLVEKHIIASAHRLLGDVENAVLLPPVPPENVVRAPKPRFRAD